MSGGSTLRAGIAAGSGAAGALAGNIDVNATGAIALDGDGTFLSNAVLENATGTGGDVNLTANSLTATNGVQIYAGTRGQADAGSVNMNVSNAASFDGAKTFSSGAYSRVESAGRGQGGSVNLTAGSLSVTNGAVLQASTFGRGNAGSVNINVRETAIFDGTTIDDNVVFSSGIYNRVETAKSAVGEGGSINIAAGSLFVTGGAVITASTGAEGNAGNVTVTVRDRIILDGTGPLSPALGFRQSSGLFSSVKETAVGEGGNIRIATRSLSVTNSALVIASALGKGNGGRILIDADTVNLAGVDDGQPSGIYNTTEPTATGRAGEITINANSLRVADGAVITSRTLNAGDGGNIAINARTFEAINGGQVLTTANSRGSAGNINLNVSESMMLSGSDRTFAGRVFDAGTNFLPNTFGAASGIYANTSANSTGAGGSLNVQTGQLTVREGAEVTVSSDGKGAAGNLRIDARSIRLDGGAIKATTQAGNFGNITLQAPDLRMQGNSQITTNAFGTAIGGNINIDTQFLIAKENSDIRANAVRGRGGNIVINAEGIFRSLDSDIDASSELGIDGNVELRTPATDPVQGLNLPENPGVPAQLTQACEASPRRASRFVITGRGGLPPAPRELVSGDNNYQIPEQLVEAQGWIINSKGEVELVVNSPEVVPYSPGAAPPICE